MCAKLVRTNEQAEEILKNISQGSTLAAEGRRLGVGRSKLCEWLKKDYAYQYTAATVARADFHADRIMEIAEDTTIEVQRARLMIDSIKFIAARLMPDVYGEKVHQTHTVTYAQALDSLPDPKELKPIN
jgi:hypothetical protein